MPEELTLPTEAEASLPAPAEAPAEQPAEAPIAPPAPQPDYHAHFAELLLQAAQLQESLPDFDLSEALKDPRFLRMTAPDVGIPVENAYYALHHRELQSAAQENAARETERKISNAVQAGAARPRENGSSAVQSHVAPDIRRMSDAQRAELRSRIRTAAANGQKLYLSDVLQLG